MPEAHNNMPCTVRRSLAYHMLRVRARLADEAAASAGRPAVAPHLSRGAVELLRVHLPAWFAASAFALHPVHTEAVAGVVGHAELLCAAASIPALLLYCWAADMDAGRSTGSAALGGGGEEVEEEEEGRSRRGSRRGSLSGSLRHWLFVLGAVLLTWLAALCKEIGITVVGAMAVYDLLLVPLAPSHGSSSTQGQRQGESTSSKQGQGQGQGQHHSSKQQAAQKGGLASLLRRRKWARLLLVGAAAVFYVKARGSVAGDHLVRIYRKVGLKCNHPLDSMGMDR